ncbi:MAG TPA: hypothetical protein VIE13_06420 [Terriglobales bacterium]|jgi:hypothetical protein
MAISDVPAPGRQPRTISVRAYPTTSSPGLLDRSYRWVRRFLPPDKEDARKVVTTVRKRWAATPSSRRRASTWSGRWPGRPTKGMMLLGLRGVGKTVLLNLTVSASPRAIPPSVYGQK